MNTASYERVLNAAHALRGMAQQIAADRALDDAIAAVVDCGGIGHYRATHGLAQDEATLRAVRVLAQLGEDLTGERIASEPGTGAHGRSDGSARGVRALSLVKQSFGEAS